MADGLDLELLRRAVAAGRIQWHHHALERLFERGIGRAEVLRAIANGEVIEHYAERQRLPGGLILHVEEQPIHVVVAADPAALMCHVVTAYRPDREHFEADFKTRRKQ